MSICTPAMVYLVFSIIAIIGIISKGLFASSVVIKGIFVLLWTWFLNFLCVKGHTTIAWFLVLLPFLLMIAMVAVAMEVVATVAKNASSRPNQPSNGNNSRSTANTF